MFQNQGEVVTWKGLEEEKYPGGEKGRRVEEAREQGMDPRDEAVQARRDTLKTLMGIGLALPVVVRGAQPGDGEARKASPREGDLFVFALGARRGEVITLEDLPVKGPQILAFPMDPESGVVRDGTRLNQVLLVRVNPELLSAETRPRSAAGIVAYSGVCTHTGCDITEWNGEAGRFQCPCHESQFDPADNARVVGGPAPWRLAALPLKIEDNMITAAGGFEGRVGFQQPGADPFGGF